MVQKGPFSKAKRLRRLIQILNDIMCQIRTTSSHMASGAQSLSQGSAEQASSVQEQAAALTEITQQRLPRIRQS